MITKEQFNEQGIKIADQLVGNAALEWLSKNTTLVINLDDVATLQALPFSAKMFIIKFCEIMGKSSVVASQSIEGLSQTFVETDKSELLWGTAEELLSDYLKGRVTFVAATRKWR